MRPADCSHASPGAAEVSMYDLRDVTASYGNLIAVRNVSLSFRSSELVAIAGPNGAGKSTLLNVMAGLRAFEHGNCLLKGRDVRHWPRLELARIAAVVPQSVR